MGDLGPHLVLIPDPEYTACSFLPGQNRVR